MGLDEYQRGARCVVWSRVTRTCILHLWPDPGYQTVSTERYDHLALVVEGTDPNALAERLADGSEDRTQVGERRGHARRGGSPVRAESGRLPDRAQALRCRVTRSPRRMIAAGETAGRYRSRAKAGKEPGAVCRERGGGGRWVAPQRDENRLVQAPTTRRRRGALRAAAWRRLPSRRFPQGRPRGQGWCSATPRLGHPRSTRARRHSPAPWAERRASPEPAVATHRANLALLEGITPGRGLVNGVLALAYRRNLPRQLRVGPEADRGRTREDPARGPEPLPRPRKEDGAGRGLGPPEGQGRSGATQLAKAEPGLEVPDLKTSIYAMGP